MLSDQQLATLKQALLDQKKKADSSENPLAANSEREATGELSSYDNHPADLGTELHDREAEQALQNHHNEELRKIEDALTAIEDGTYGTCRECGEEIPYERLEVLPYTLTCIHHSDTRLPYDEETRPIEEDVLEAPLADSFEKLHQEGIRDYKDSFAEVAQYGTSETPADFLTDYEDYNDLYTLKKDGFAEEFETFTATDITGDTRGFVHSERENKLTHQLDEEGIESPLGDIPYRKRDSYLEEN